MPMTEYGASDKAEIDMVVHTLSSECGKVWYD